VTSPFENDAADYVVLVNDRAQYSLWPAANDVPAGWRTVEGPASRRECLDFVELHWQDLRPSGSGGGRAGEVVR
jgi:MbtH protein